MLKKVELLCTLLFLMTLLTAVVFVASNSPQQINAANFVNVSDSIDNPDERDVYFFDLERGWDSLDILLDGPDGGESFFLYANPGSEPADLSTSAFSSEIGGSGDQTINITDPTGPTTWYVIVYSEFDTGGYSLTADTTGMGMPEALPLTNDQVESATVAANTQLAYQISLPAIPDNPDFVNIELSQTGGPGTSLQLYATQASSQPDKVSEYSFSDLFTCCSSPVELEILEPDTGNWYVVVRNEDFDSVDYDIRFTYGYYEDVSVVGEASTTASGTQSVQLAYTASSAHDAAVVFIKYRDPIDISGNSVTSVSRNSQNFSLVSKVESSSGNYALETFSIMSPNTGNHQLTVDFTRDADEITVIVFGLSGVDTTQTEPFYIYNTGTSSLSSLDISTSGNPLQHYQIGIAMSTNRSDISSLTPGPVEDIIYSETNGSSSTQARLQSMSGTIASPVDLVSWQTALNSNMFGFAASVYRGYTLTNTPPDLVAPVVTLNEPAGIYIRSDYIFTGNFTDDVDASSLTFTINGGSPQVASLSGSTTNKTFSIDISSYSLSGSNTILLTGLDAANNSGTDSFTFTIDDEAPTCDLTNQLSPNPNTTLTYTNITCTDNFLVNSVEFRVYHNIYGDVQAYTVIPAPVDGTYDEASEQVTFTTDFLPNDGDIQVLLQVEDGAGNFPDGAFRPLDQVIIEARDESSPTVLLDDVLPAETVNNRPFITGSCGDVSEFDTNSYITAMYYRIEAGSWINLPAISGALNDSFVENFAFRIPEGQELSDGARSITVRCVDAAGNDTNISGSNDTTFFTVETADSGLAPELYTISETFSSDNFFDSNRSDNVIWGRDRLRLKENLGFNETLIDDIGFLPRYSGPSFDESAISLTRSSDGVSLWYENANQLLRYNTQTDSVTKTYNSTFFGVGPLSDLAEVTVGGTSYLWLTARSGLVLVNTNTDDFVVYNDHGFDSTDKRPNIVLPDNRNTADLGAWVRLDIGTGTYNLLYISTNGTFTDTSDDEILFFTTGDGFENDYVSVYRETGTNYIYAGSYASGLDKWNDNGTPTNLLDDTFVSNTGDDYDAIFSMTDDGNGIMYLAISAGPSGSLVALDSNSTPWYLPDDISTTIATYDDKLKRKPPSNIKYLAGEDGIGGQIFIVSGSHMIYANLNDTVTDLSDDTFLEYDLSSGVRPLQIADYEIWDYDTLYLTKDRAGLFRIDLNRGFETSGVAEATTTPPLDRLLANNITLLDVELLAPITTNAVSGATYEVSIDGGVTWQSITIGQIASFPQEDYRVKFRVNLTSDGEQTQVIDAYTLQFGGYSSQDQVESSDQLMVTVNPATVPVNNNFNITVTAVDALGFPAIGHSLPATLSLRQFNDPSVGVNALNVASVAMTNGVGTTSAQVSQAGEFVVRGVSGSLLDDSNKLTVTQTLTSPIPGLSFSANKYTINFGEPVTLFWESINLDGVSINRGIGNVGLSGAIVVYPTATTTYQISGIGDYGNLTASLTIVVNSSKFGTTEPGEQISPQLPIEAEEKPLDFTSGEVDDGRDSTIKIEVPTEIVVTEGDIANFFWNVEGADEVFIDYLNREVSSNGSFDFVPVTDMLIRITARSNGEEVVREVQVRVNPDLSLQGWTRRIQLGQAAVLPLVITATAGIATGFVGGFNMFGIFIGILIKRRRSYWGVVYDYYSNKPLAFARVIVKDIGGNVVAQTVSDLNGKYGLLVEAIGRYNVSVAIQNYKPYTKQVSVTDPRLDIVEDIPLVKLETKRGGLLLTIREYNRELFFMFNIFMLVLMIAGFIYTLYAASISPNFTNYLLLGAYLILFLINAFILLKPFIYVARGRVVEGSKDKGVAGCSVRFYSQDKQVEVSLTNSNGEVKVNLPPNTYEIIVHKNGYELESVNSNGTLEVVVGKDGKISKYIRLVRDGINTVNKNKTDKVTTNPFN